MSEIRVFSLRLSFVWLTTYPLTGPRPLLGNSVEYEKAVGRAKSGDAEWLLPWPKTHGEHFWERYLEIKNLKKIDAKQAWRHLMPLRVPSPASIETPSNVRVAMEGFCYPHALAAVGTVVITEDLPLDEMVDAAIEASQQSKYEVVWPEGSATAQLTLPSLASGVMDRWHERMFAGAGPPLAPLGDPLVVAAVLDGQGAEPGKPVDPKSDLHRALEGLCTLRPVWRIADLHPLDDSTSLKLGTKGRVTAGCLLYGLDRSRAIWFPSCFSEHLKQGERVHTVGCYSRNLTLLSLQTGSLLGLLREAADMLDSLPFWKRRLGMFANALTRNAVTCIRRLYGAEQGTYRSWSARVQIERDVETVNRMCKYFKQDLLHDSGSPGG